MNVLQNALTHIQTLIQNQRIIIINEQITNLDGFANIESTELETIAHVQPVTPIEVSKITHSTLDSPVLYRFYFLDNLAEVLNSLYNKSSIILWRDKHFRVYAKSDWSLNGWVKVTAVEILQEESDVQH